MSDSKENPMTDPTQYPTYIPEPKEPKRIPVTKWTITATIITALFLIGIGGVIAAPEPEIKTVTETKYERIEVPGETKYERIEVPGETKYEMSPQCKTAFKDTAQAFITVISSYSLLSEGASQFDTQKITAAGNMIKRLDGGNIGRNIRLCDPEIADSLDTTGL